MSRARYKVTVFYRGVVETTHLFPTLKAAQDFKCGAEFMSRMRFDGRRFEVSAVNA